MISRQGETPLEKTIYVLKNMNLFDMSPFKEKEAYFRRLLDVANVNALSPKERATYDENLKIYRDWKATMEYAVEEAETKGKEESRCRSFISRRMHGAFVGNNTKSLIW